MTRSVALAAVTALFLLGIAAGGLAVHQLHGGGSLRDLHPHGNHIHSPDERFMQQLDEVLELTPGQKERLKEVLREGHREARRLHEEMLPRVRAQMEETRKRVMEILTPEQQEEFEKIHFAHRSGAERFFLGHTGPVSPEPEDDPDQ